MIDLKKFYDAANAAEARVQALASQINAAFDAGETEKALEMRPQLDKAKAEAKEAQQLYLSMQAASLPEGDPGRKFVPLGGEQEPRDVAALRASNEYVQEFFNALRVGASPKTIRAGQHRAESFGRLMNALTETGGVPAGAEGGFLLPTDFDTRIKTFRRLAVDLSSWVTTEQVSTMAGWRAMEVASAALPFAAIADAPAPVFPLSRLAEMENPTFQRVVYALVDYGGFLPIANDLLSDTPSAIMEYLARWCGRKESLTNTNLIVTLALATLVPVPNAVAADVFVAIDTALNVTLDPAISASASIVTNQNGLNLMDSITDGAGRKWLTPDPTNATRLMYKGRPIVVVPNAQLADLALNTCPIAVGDGREFMMHFHGGPGVMDSTTVGGGAWRSNDTEIRYIMRADDAIVDAAAVSLISQTTV